MALLRNHLLQWHCCCCVILPLLCDGSSQVEKQISVTQQGRQLAEQQAGQCKQQATNLQVSCI